MTMVPSTLVNALTSLWTNPPEERSYTETADAIENFWLTATVSGGFSSATLFAAQVTHTPLAPVGGEATAAAAAQAFENACETMVTATTFTPSGGASAISAPPVAVLPAALPGALQSTLQTIFEDAQQSGTSAATQASLVGNAIADYLAGWQVTVTTPGPTQTPTPIV